MNDRQKAILKILLEETVDFLSSHQIAHRLNCSEKTVRTDSKKIDEWLSVHSKSILIRKPNSGFWLEVSPNERNRLLNILADNDVKETDLEEDERITRILEWLLIGSTHLTIQKLSDTFYINKAVIKKDLEKIESYLRNFNLTLTAKKKLGIALEGKEQDFRLALAKLPDYLGEKSKQMEFLKNWFEIHEIELVNQWLDKMNKNSSNPYTDVTVQNLLLHILISVKRLKLGYPISLPKVELEKIKVKKEYGLAKDLMDYLEKVFNIRFSQNETAYIALHFMGGRLQRANADKGNEIDGEVKLLTESLVNHFSVMSNIDFKTDSELTIGLNVHLQSTLNRLKHGLSVTNPILEDIKRMYPYLFNLVVSEFVQLNKEFPYQIPEDEAAFVTLHFQASVERLQKRNGKNKRAVIVCPMGIGASVLLRTKLDRKFHSLEIIDSVSISKINQFTNENVDFIISTIPMNHTTLPVIKVSPLLTDEEQKKLHLFIDNLGQNNHDFTDSQFPYLREILRSELILFHLSFHHQYEVIKSLAKRLVEYGYVSEEYMESAIIRERHSSTCIGGGIAIPHGDPNFIKKSGIAIGLLENPIRWGKDDVSLVLFLATKPEEYKKTKQLFTEIGLLSENPLLVRNLTKQGNVNDLLKFL